ncbi:MAG: hypothetical protein ACJ76V_10700 [Thermoleophilaceae bacterium]
MRIPRTRGGLTGLVLMILGAWAALIPFVGPYFNYQMHNDQTWFWFADRMWLEVLPGAAIFIGGLVLTVSAFRASARTGALVAALGGIWLVIGPSMSMLWHHGQIQVGPALGSTGTRTLEWIGFFYGAGALAIALASYAYGMLTTRPVVDTAEAVAAGTAGGVAPRDRAYAREPVARAGAGRGAVTGAAAGAATGAATGRAVGRRRRGGLFGRFRRDRDGDGIPDNQETQVVDREGDTVGTTRQ